MTYKMVKSVNDEVNADHKLVETLDVNITALIEGLDEDFQAALLEDAAKLLGQAELKLKAGQNPFTKATTLDFIRGLLAIGFEGTDNQKMKTQSFAGRDSMVNRSVAKLGREAAGQSQLPDSEVETITTDPESREAKMILGRIQKARMAFERVKNQMAQSGMDQKLAARQSA